MTAYGMEIIERVVVEPTYKLPLSVAKLVEGRMSPESALLVAGEPTVYRIS